MNIENISELLAIISPQLAERLGGLITILKAVGIAFIVYVVYLVVKLVFSLKTIRRIKRIENKIDLIEKKLNKKSRK